MMKVQPESSLILGPRFLSILVLTRTMKRTIVACFLAICFTLPAFADDDIVNALRPREIGPATFSGRIVDIEVDPTNGNRIFAASASGGLWLSENNGTTWKCIFENEKTISIGDIAIDPNNPKIIWIGTGEANNQRSSFWGDGVYRSNDGGRSWQNMGLGDSHHIGRVIVDPKDSNTVYVAALGHLYSANSERGLFKTSDGGSTWEKVLYINDKVGVVDVVIDPSNSKILYAASYERLRRAWDFDGAGPGSAIYRSTDAGHTWKKMGGGLPSGEIGRIGLTIFPGNSKIVYATVSNQNIVFPESKPVRRRVSDNDEPKKKSDEPKAKKDDAEKDDAEKDDAKKEDAEKADQKLESADDQTVIETPFGFEIEKVEQKWLVKKLRTSNPNRQRGLSNESEVIQCAGLSIEDVSQLRTVLKNMKPTDKALIEVRSRGKVSTIELIVPESPAAQGTPIGGEIYVTKDGGESWKKVNQQPVGGRPAYYYGQIRVDPSDEKRLYLLSVPLYTSTNGGRTWSTLAGSVHVDHHAFWIDPKNPQRVILGNDGGLHQSYDYGKSWDTLPNLPLAQFYAITADMQMPYHVYGGTQDNGSWGAPSRTGSRRGIANDDWYRVGGGDGFYVQVDPRNPDVLIGESQFGAVFKSNRATGQRKSIRPRPTNSSELYRFNWNSPILMSVHDSNVVYFGGNKLFRSSNQGDLWEEISGDLTGADPEKLKGNVPHCTITTISESRTDRRLLMVGTDDGKVHVTRDGGETWTDLSNRFPVAPALWWCSRVEISAHDKNVAYVSFTGYREDDFRSFLFATTDGGESWKSISANLPAEPVNVIKEDPVNPDLLFVGTEFGLYISLDRGESWSPVKNIPRVSIQDLLVHSRDSDLIVGSHGRGMFIVDDISPLQQLNQKSDADARLLTPRTAIVDRRDSGGSYSGDRHFFGANPSSQARVWYQLKNDAKVKLKISVSDVLGKEILSVDLEQKKGLHYVSFPVGNAVSSFRGRSQRTPPSLKTGSYRISLLDAEGNVIQSEKLDVTDAK